MQSVERGAHDGCRAMPAKSDNIGELGGGVQVGARPCVRRIARPVAKLASPPPDLVVALRQIVRFYS